MNPSRPHLPTPRRDLTGKKFYPPAGRERVVGSSLGCRRCGYNLKTLSTRTRCPECGEPVERSVRHHDAERFRRLRVTSQQADGSGPHVNRYVFAIGMTVLGCMLIVAGAGPHAPPGAGTLAGLAMLGGGGYLLLWKLFHPDG